MSIHSPTPMATRIQSLEEIDQLQEINGLPIQEIEQRAHPKNEFEITVLGQEESFQNCLKTDWETVAQLGKTHIEIASTLTKLWTQAPIGQDQWKEDRNVHISILEGSRQSNVLYNPNSDQESECWDSFLYIVDNTTQTIHIIGKGVISHIEQYGFYGGNGERNLYRVDPGKLIDTLYKSENANQHSIG